MKIISLYLPQFHPVKENDEWWGEGFTEWTTVRAAEKFHNGQCQPRVPLHDNYYNLLDKDTMKWQSQLMKKYGIYGMCFYHYYFKDARMILEKPAENLLRWKDIDMPFCFSWANESWSRTWSNVSNTNIWTSKFERETNLENKQGLLLEQDYGSEEDWEQHFYYLLPFFKDKRYIKEKNCPIFVIYRPLSIPCLTKMIEKWRMLAKKEGFPDLYFVGTGIEQKMSFDAVLIQEPQNTIRKMDRKLFIDSKEVWDVALKQEALDGVKTLFCGFSGYDDTPRRGSGGIALSMLSPLELEEYMGEIISKSRYYHNDYLFFNAWNEWGEGMYLEPDEENGYGYLEAISRAINNAEKKRWKPKDNTNDSDNTKLITRYKNYWTIFDKWLYKLEENHNVSNYFRKRNYKNIAIYGMGMIAKHLQNNLDDDINIAYGVDIRGNEMNLEYPIFFPSDVLPNVDVIVVTPSYDFDIIYKELKKKNKCEIVSIDEVIEEC